MTEKELFDMIDNIAGADAGAVKAAEERQDALAKPPGSLGKLEKISIKMAGITGEIKGCPVKPAVMIMSADNGVVAEGVSSAPQSVTMAQTINFTKKLTGVGALASTFGVDLLVTDVGINGTVPKSLRTDDPAGMAGGKILDRKIAYGTGNLAREPAMTDEQVLEALHTGMENVRSAVDMGYDMIGVGEMGIGNTTTSTAVLSAVAGIDPGNVTGRGGGLTDDSLAKKKRLITEAIERNGLKCGGRNDVLNILAKVGGFDIAAMAGVFLGAAVCRVPVVVDGFISAVAALAAARLSPVSTDFMLASHISEEPGYAAAIRELELEPMLDLEMRLGEGSGCVLAFQIIKGACGVMKNMATFAEAMINDEYLEEIRKGDCF